MTQLTETANSGAHYARRGQPMPKASAPSKGRRRRPLKIARVAGAGVLFVAAIAILAPLFVMLRIALAAPADTRDMPIRWWNPAYWGGLKEVLHSDFLHRELNSFIVAIVTTAIVMALSTVSGHALARIRGKGKDRFLLFVLSTRMGPAVVYALPIFILAADAHAVDSYLVLIVTYVFYSLAFAMWMMHGFFLDIPPEVEEAGLLDGLSTWGVFRRVSVPMALPGVIATAILVFIFTWNEFFYAFVLTRTNAATFPTAVPSYFGAFQVDWPQMFSASLLGSLPPVVLGIMVRRWLTRGMSGGAVS